MIKGLDHIGIVVKDLDRSLAMWQAAVSATVVHREVISDQQVEVVVLQIGSIHVELIHPTTADSSVARFLAKRGEGIHHIALECDSAQGELERAKGAGVQLIDTEARAGADHSHIGFVHPRSLSGVLVEFVDHGGHPADRSK